jgi:hypothetical protein
MASMSRETALSRENSQSRWHQEQVTKDHRRSWACIPLNDAIQAVEDAARTPGEPGLREALRDAHERLMEIGATNHWPGDDPEGCEWCAALSQPAEAEGEA